MTYLPIVFFMFFLLNLPLGVSLVISSGPRLRPCGPCSVIDPGVTAGCVLQAGTTSTKTCFLEITPEYRVEKLLRMTRRTLPYFKIRSTVAFTQENPTDTIIPAYPVLMTEDVTDLSSTSGAVGILFNGVSVFR